MTPHTFPPCSTVAGARAALVLSGMRIKESGTARKIVVSHYKSAVRARGASR